MWFSRIYLWYSWKVLGASLNKSMTKEDFLGQHGQESFKYSEELLEGLESGECEFTSYTGGEKNRMTGKAFVEIYGRKAKNLNQSDDDYSKTLQDDLIDLCKVMEKLGDEIVDVWSFSDGPTFYSAFVPRSTGKVVSVVKTKS